MYAYNNKSVNTWTKLVIAVAREQTPLLHQLVYFQMPTMKASGLKSFNICVRKLPLSQKRYLKGSRFSHTITIQYNHLY